MDESSSSCRGRLLASYLAVFAALLFFPDRHTVAAELLEGAQPGTIAAACTGDCDGDGIVDVNELVTGVNIALGTSTIAACPAFDSNGNGLLRISTLVVAVGDALYGCGPRDACGNGRREGTEECDDGNRRGGDGCAVNCTAETDRVGVINSEATVQLFFFLLRLPLVGTQTLTTGSARDDGVERTVGGRVVRPGDIPVVVREGGVQIEPIASFGAGACICLQAVAPTGPNSHGAGNVGSGVISCGVDGATDVDVVLQRDHNTTPGSAGNVGGLADDPECDDRFVAVGGASDACLEGSDESCSGVDNTHPGVCNSPLVASFGGGGAPRGSAILNTNLSVTFLRDGGRCMESRFPDGITCRWDDYGPDCLPCTPDDTPELAPVNVQFTTGTAEASLFDSDNAGRDISPTSQCGGAACVAGATGSPFDCDALQASPQAGLAGGALVTAAPSLDTRGGGDIVLTMPLRFE